MLSSGLSPADALDLTDGGGSSCSPSSAAHPSCLDGCILLYLLSSTWTLSLGTMQHYRQVGEAQQVQKQRVHSKATNCLGRWDKTNPVSKTSAALLLPLNRKPVLSWLKFPLVSVCQSMPRKCTARSYVTHLFMIHAACLVRTILPPFKTRFIIQRYMKKHLQLPASF